MKLPVWLRWCLIPVVAVAGCSGVTWAGDLAGYSLQLAVPGPALESAIPLDVRTGLIDGAAAVAFVVGGAMIAPRCRLLTATMLYSLGAYVAWFVLNPWWFPEGLPRAYQPSLVPLALTLSGGLVGLLITLTLHRRSSIVAWTTARHEPSASGEAAG